MRAAACALALCASSCGDPTPLPPTSAPVSVPPPPPAPASPLVLRVGTGALRFEDVEDGAEVPLIFGPQGGYHVWTAFRVEGAAGLTAVRVEMSATLDDTGAQVGPPSTLARVTLAAAGDGAEAAGLRNFVSMPAEVRGRRVTLRVEVTTPGGRRGAAARVVVPR